MFPSAQKQGRVTTLLKNHGLDQSDIGELQCHSSYYRRWHSVTWELRPSMTSSQTFDWNGKCSRWWTTRRCVVSVRDQLATVCLSLHISATFDTIDHNILLDHISWDFSICSTALSWLQSFVTDRTQDIAVWSSQQSVNVATAFMMSIITSSHVHIIME